MTSVNSPTSLKYTQVDGDGSTIFGTGGRMKAAVKEAALQTFDVLRRGITNRGRHPHERGGAETERLIDVEDDGSPQLASKKFVRRWRKDLGHWCHVEAILESVKYNCPMRIMYAFEHGIRSILERPDLTLLDIEDCLLTALFLELLGCKVDFAYIHAIKLSAHPSATLLQKKIGYLLCSMCMDQDDEKTILLVNNIHKDLQATDSVTISTALRAAAKCVPPQHYDMLLPFIWKHADNTTDIYIRKLALVTLHSFLLKQCGFHKTPEVDASCRLAVEPPSAVPCSDTVFSARNKNELLISLLKASSRGSHLSTMELCKTIIIHTTTGKETAPMKGGVPLDVTFGVLEHIFEFGKRNFFANGDAVTPHVKVCIMQVSWLRLLAAALSTSVNIPEFPQVMDEICEFHRTNIDIVPNATKYEMVRLAATEPYLSLFKGNKTPKISMYLSSLFAFADSLIYIDDSSSEDESSPSYTRRRKRKKEPTEMELNMAYISIRCISLLSNCDRDRGMSRHAPVLRGLVSTDPTVLLASVDVLCAAARATNVRAILRQLLNFIRKPPSRITNFATINNLRVALVSRANELSWRVAKTANPELHLKAASLLLTHCSSSMFGVESEEEAQGFAILDWLHEELSLQAGEPIFGHGDLELRVDLQNTATRAGSERNLFRRQVCKHMLNTLQVYTKNLHNGLSKFVYRNDPIFLPPTEPVLVRVASWVIGEFGPAFAPHDCQLNGLFLLLIENLHGSLSPAPGVIMAMSKIVFLYAQLRLTEQPIVVNGRSTSLSVDAIEDAEQILERKTRSRDTTVASTAGESLFLIRYAIDVLKNFKTKNAMLAPTNTEDASIFEELSLPFSTGIAQESDDSLSFLNGFVKSQTELLEQQGKVVKPYMKLCEREERIVSPDPDEDLELRNDAAYDNIRKLLGTDNENDPQIDLIAPTTGPWGKGGYGVNSTDDLTADELVLNSPISQSTPTSFPKKKIRPRRKKANAWFREAVELATTKSGRRPKIAKTVQGRDGLTSGGGQFRWGAPTGGIIPSVPQYQMIGDNDEIDPSSPIRSGFGMSFLFLCDCYSVSLGKGKKKKKKKKKQIL